MFCVRAYVALALCMCAAAAVTTRHPAAIHSFYIDVCCHGNVCKLRINNPPASPTTTAVNILFPICHAQLLTHV